MPTNAVTDTGDVGDRYGDQLPLALRVSAPSAKTFAEKALNPASGAGASCLRILLASPLHAGISVRP